MFGTSGCKKISDVVFSNTSCKFPFMKFCLNSINVWEIMGCMHIKVKGWGGGLMNRLGASTYTGF